MLVPGDLQDHKIYPDGGQAFVMNIFILVQTLVCET